ncbi:MAG: guanylate kinase [Bacteroidetes bacterium GWF2_43_63]|nr:MAG: guanylate kinase [Bacteroidetes bacterium GWE2_42_42]OFY52782.1 MAG: guanylate kinase [Bacteroidetes bacterium GWF2_43_63]HBG70015.1 guanylate kinase [Bacteroidales bacterium]HCB62380.1 guanylate kinase [Bacteroidales bacterium]HCY22433.1 guanylate kinase [Bacteroidales bacterium]
MRKAVIFSAPSGAGKTTIVHKLIDAGLPLGFSISATSRQPRENEIDGVDYFFFSIEQFRKKVGQNEFVEWEEVYDGLYYGTLKLEVERVWNEGKAIIFDVDVKGGVSLKKIFGENALSVFIQPPSFEILEERLRFRHTESEESIQKRLDRAKYELSFAPQFDIVITNDHLDIAVSEAAAKVSDFLKS